MKLIAAGLMVVLSGSASLTVPQGRQMVPLDPQATVARIEWTRERIRTTIDGKACGDCLAALEDLRARHGAMHPLVVILDDRVPLSWLSNTKGLLGKAGLDNVRYFDLFVQTQKMSELLTGETIPNLPKK